jgi:hypothetical protein
MQVEVAGRDRSEDIGGDAARTAERLAAHPDAPRPEADGYGAGVLGEARDEARYLETLLRQLEVRADIRTTDFHIPRGRGAAARVLQKIKTWLWKLLRYQHDRMAYQANAVNAQVVGALGLLHEQTATELESLRRRVAALESRAQTREQGDSGGAGT